MPEPGCRHDGTSSHGMAVSSCPVVQCLAMLVPCRKVPTRLAMYTLKHTLWYVGGLCSALPDLAISFESRAPRDKQVQQLWPCLVPRKFCKIFQILRYIESLTHA
jgi:hypothetical protein